MSASSPSKVTVSADAYAKLMLHAAKHPAAPVLGLLLGDMRKRGGGAESKGAAPEGKGSGDGPSSSEGVDLRVVDVAPLFHTSLVAPTLEAAMMVVEQCCSAEGGESGGRWAGLSIVGCYSANRLTTSTGVTAVVSRVGQAIRKKLVAKWGAGAGRGGAAPVLVVNNGTFGGEEKAKSANMYTWSERDGSWGKQDGKRWGVEDEGLLWATKHEGREQQVVDFDDHLDDVALDFRNSWF